MFCHCSSANSAVSVEVKDGFAFDGADPDAAELEFKSRAATASCGGVVWHAPVARSPLPKDDVLDGAEGAEVECMSKAAASRVGVVRHPTLARSPLPPLRQGVP
jgi:hypothetical protein